MDESYIYISTVNVQRVSLSTCMAEYKWRFRTTLKCKNGKSRQHIHIYGTIEQIKHTWPWVVYGLNESRQESDIPGTHLSVMHIMFL